MPQNLGRKDGHAYAHLPLAEDEVSCTELAKRAKSGKKMYRIGREERAWIVNTGRDVESIPDACNLQGLGIQFQPSQLMDGGDKDFATKLPAGIHMDCDCVGTVSSTGKSWNQKQQAVRSTAIKAAANRLLDRLCGMFDRELGVTTYTAKAEQEEGLLICVENDERERSSHVHIA
ncbi:hypothetical protein K431DRAFT_287134 [Polychaeton citri CBS 116435]|uniref:Uncharacterized protein n=1 Tax=Polychaeton citri CBS 116435 TaxID=1314669 RepID=A0A9P4UML6_9PEZI|nr:hypothetical protein K431DRAFT_287134 [Polychaeton citri CBS 116435]